MIYRSLINLLYSKKIIIEGSIYLSIFCFFLFIEFFSFLLYNEFGDFMRYSILVNSENKIHKKYQERIELLSTMNIFHQEVFLEKECLKAFLEWKDFWHQQGVEVGIVSGFLKIEGSDSDSEFATGLAISFSIWRDGDFLPLDFSFSSDFCSVHSSLASFGFIVSEEPWHIRYVGKFIAKRIVSSSYTLAEYLKKYAGVVAVRKPKGITSFEVVHQIRCLFGIEKVGHTGTLDPMAEGVLIVCIGPAVKIAELLTSYDKE